MRTEYHVTGERRRELIKVIEVYTGEPATSLSRPEGATVIGLFTVTADGALEFSDWTDSKFVEGLYEAIDIAGFKPCEDGMIVKIPRSSMTDEAIVNLRQIVDNKSGLLKKAIGTDDLSIIVTPNVIQFPWFPEPDADTFVAYGRLVEGLCEMARTVSRVNRNSRTIENEKYAMRCFLLRLGFVGPEFKQARKVLLKNFSGSAAFRTQAGAEAFIEKQKAKRLAEKGLPG